MPWSRIDLMANRKNASDGVEQNDLLNDLKNLATDKSKMSFRATVPEFLQCILSDVALNASRANTFMQALRIYPVPLTIRDSPSPAWTRMKKP